MVKQVKSEIKALTQLSEKNHCPMVTRRYSKYGPPIFVGIITDDDLSDMDDTVIEFMNQEDSQAAWKSHNIQQVRNLCGNLSECLIKKYPRMEGLAVMFVIDKGFITSLHGDFMSHQQCKFEFYMQVQIATNL